MYNLIVEASLNLDVPLKEPEDQAPTLENIIYSCQ